MSASSEAERQHANEAAFLAYSLLVGARLQLETPLRLTPAAAVLLTIIREDPTAARYSLVGRVGLFLNVAANLSPDNGSVSAAETLIISGAATVEQIEQLADAVAALTVADLAVAGPFELVREELIDKRPKPRRGRAA